MTILWKRQVSYRIGCGTDMVHASTFFKWIYFGIWTHSPKYKSDHISMIFIGFADHENIGKETMFMVLSCTDQMLWPIVLYPNMVIWPYTGIIKNAHKSLTIYRKAMNFVSIPRFSSSANMIKIIELWSDSYFWLWVQMPK